MSAAIVIRHVVSLAGCVRESPSAFPPSVARDAERRLAGVLVQIVAGPPAFETLRAASALNPQRQRQADCTHTQADGIYFFVDLPPGAYHLRISAPEYGSRFGAVEIGPVDVTSPQGTGELHAVRADVYLPSTRVRGVVTRTDTGDPVARALVRIRGDPQAVRSDDAGRYELRRLVQGRSTIEISAPDLATARRTVTLAAGDEQVVDIQLDPPH